MQILAQWKDMQLKPNDQIYHRKQNEYIHKISVRAWDLSKEEDILCIPVARKPPTAGIFWIKKQLKWITGWILHFLIKI